MFGPAPPLNDPLFRGLVTRADLFKVINEGRVGTPMPAFSRRNGGKLTEFQIQILIDGLLGTVREQVGAVANKLISSPWGVVAPVPKATPPYLLPTRIGNADNGARLFSRACASCHGKNGLGTAPHHNDRINDVAFLSLISDQALRRIMITGRADLKMPDYASKTSRSLEFEPLTSDDLVDLGALLSYWRQGREIRID